MIWPYRVPPTTPARVHDYLTGGKDHFAADRRIADQVVVASPRYFVALQQARDWIAEMVRHLAEEEGIDQFLVYGPSFPRPSKEPALHDLLTHATFTYIDPDIEVVVAARAHWRTDAVTVLDGDLAEPKHLLADPGMHGALDSTRPAALVIPYRLQHLADTEITPAAKALAAALPEGSRLVAAHPAPDLAAAADAYRAGTAAAGVAERCDVRDIAHLDRLLSGWALARTGVAAQSRITDHGLVTITARLP